MKTFALLAVFAALVIAQSSTSSSLSPTASCLAGCRANDSSCQAACVGVAHPNGPQANATNNCAAQCTQGNGSKAENEAYGKCVSQCINQHFPTTQTLVPGVDGNPTPAPNLNGDSSSSMGQSVQSTGTDSTSESMASGSSTANGSASAGSATSTGAAPVATEARLGAPMAGMAALLMAVVAL